MVFTTTTIARRRSVIQIALAAVTFPIALAAQPAHQHPPHPAPAQPAAPAAANPQPAHQHPAPPAHADHPAPARAAPGNAANVDVAMSGPLVVSPYMKLTAARKATAADSARAAQVAAELRMAIAKYKDVRVAQADGYEIFAPGLKQEVYHFTSNWRSVKEAFRFDPAQPSSLLYRKTPDGNFELVGAMYHAPKRASDEKLNERVPLSIARWHAHTNFCVPKRREQNRWLEMKDGKPVFGPAGGISTQAQCDAVKGKFHEQVFGWMVHAMVFAGDDPASIWGNDHAAHGSGHRH